MVSSQHCTVIIISYRAATFFTKNDAVKELSERQEFFHAF